MLFATTLHTFILKKYKGWFQSFVCAPSIL